MYWKEPGVAHRIKERMNSNLRQGKSQGQKFRRPQQKNLWTTSLGAAITLILLHYSSFWVYESVQVSSSRRDHWLCLGQGPILQPISLTQQKCSHWLPTPCLGTFPEKGDLLWTGEPPSYLVSTMVGACFLAPNWSTTSKTRKNSTQNSLWGNHFFFR